MRNKGYLKTRISRLYNYDYSILERVFLASGARAES